MRKTSILILCALMIISALALPLSASALGLYDAAFWKAWSGAVYYNYGMVHFLGGTKATGAYNTVSGRIIKQAYVRLVEGSYDSGRCYTGVGPASSNGVDYGRTIKKSYNPLAVCYGYYGWLYY